MTSPLRLCSFLVAATLLSCDQGSGSFPEGCPDIGCDSGFEVTFTGATQLSAGSYRVEVIADAKAGACDIAFPLTCDRRPVCTGDMSWRVGLSGCALPPAQHQLSGVRFSPATPAQVEITVLSGARRLGNGRFTPVYTTSRAGGPNCGPVCTQAPRASLTLE